MRWLSPQGTRLTQPQGAVGAASQTPWALFSFGEGARPKNRGLRGPQGNWTLSASNSLIATAAGLGLKNGTSVSGAVFANVRAFDGVSPANSPLWYMVTFVHGAYVNQGSGINLVFQYGSPDSSAGIYLRVNSANVLTAFVANTALTGPTLVAGRAYAVVAGRDASGACWLWVNGAKVASGTGATAALSAQSSALYLSGGEGTNRAFQGVVNAFAMGSESPSEFGASISANPWQLFEPERRIWVPVSATGSSNGNASGAPAALSLTAGAATGAGTAQSTGAPVAVALSAPAATATTSALAASAPAAVSLSAPQATASGTAQAAGAASAVSLTAATATADGTEAVNPAVPAGLNFSTVNGFALNGAPPLLTGGQAYGAPAGLTLVASNATAVGTANAAGTAPTLTLVAPTATATGQAQAASAPVALALSAPTATAQGTAQASSAPTALSLSSPQGEASAAGHATASGAPATLSLAAPQASAAGTANAQAAPHAVTLSAPTATASNANSATATGAPATLTLVPPSATASGSGQALAAPPVLTLVAPTATANGLTTLVDEPDLIRPAVDGRLLYRPPLEARAIDRPPLESRLIVRVAPETELRKAA